MLALFLGSEECWECWEDDDFVGFTCWGADIALLREGASDLSVLRRVECWEYVRVRRDELLGEGSKADAGGVGIGPCARTCIGISTLPGSFLVGWLSSGTLAVLEQQPMGR